jgi:uncharacterized protein (TIGR02996 family)
MDPHEPFLKAILADRQNDLPRLVYADWLEETGEPSYVARAHFIRTQIHLEMADLTPRLYDDLKVLEGRTLTTYLDEWRWELPEFVRYWSTAERVQWRRGFADDLGSMSVQTFAEYGAAAIDAQPLTSLHLSDRQAPIWFERFTALTNITRLKLGPTFDPLVNPIRPSEETTVTFDSLLSAPVFTGLRQLDLSGNGLTNAWVLVFAARFASASFAPTLETLNLSGNFGITDAGANVLATAPGLDRLTKLHLRDTSISSAGMSQLKKRFGNRVTASGGT